MTIPTAILIEGDYGSSESVLPKMVQGGLAGEHMRLASIVSLVRSGINNNPDNMKSLISQNDSSSFHLGVEQNFILDVEEVIVPSNHYNEVDKSEEYKQSPNASDGRVAKSVRGELPLITKVL